jgi:EAL domain-containing protein (putative c-di-GMP-specific phosphodiesterase class I)
MSEPSVPRRVFVVDDDEFLGELIEEQLRALGVQHVGRAIDGARALASIAIADDAWELLVCDLDMPGMDGIEFARHLAQRSFRGGLMLTSGADLRLAETVGHLVERHRLRFVGAFRKPLGGDAFVRAFETLERVQARQTARPALELLSVEDVRAGLERGDRLQLAYQPKVSLRERKVVGAECLARWRDPARGMIPPAAFIPVAEEHGLIEPLTRQVFAQAAAQLGRWVEAGHPLTLSVNVSMDDLTRLELPDEFAAAAHRANLDPGQLVLELTETRLMRDASAALEILARLRLKGFGLSIDDFGTGYSNLGNLKLLPFNELKVDRAFVHGATHDTVARAILESSVRLAKALDMDVVAEGAETRDDLALLEQVGCDVVQGYVIARPMPADDFVAWKVRWEAG